LVFEHCTVISGDGPAVYTFVLLPGLYDLDVNASYNPEREFCKNAHDVPGTATATFTITTSNQHVARELHFTLAASA
jgi:hypothetical protein